jgi:hypothetical protein
MHSRDKPNLFQFKICYNLEPHDDIEPIYSIDIMGTR